MIQLKDKVSQIGWKTQIQGDARFTRSISET